VSGSPEQAESAMPAKSTNASISEFNHVKTFPDFIGYLLQKNSTYWNASRLPEIVL
jgi:hypothetical protein